MVEQIFRIMTIDIDTKQVSKLSFVEFAINSLINASTGKIPFELVYGQQVKNVVDQFDGLYWVEGA